MQEYVDAEFARRPEGSVDAVHRLNFLRREHAWEGESCLSESAISAAITAAIIALRQKLPDAAAKLRALGTLPTFLQLGEALAVLADARPRRLKPIGEYSGLECITRPCPRDLRAWPLRFQ